MNSSNNFETKAGIKQLTVIRKGEKSYGYEIQQYLSLLHPVIMEMIESRTIKIKLDGQRIIECEVKIHNENTYQVASVGQWIRVNESGEVIRIDSEAFFKRNHITCGEDMYEYVNLPDTAYLYDNDDIDKFLEFFMISILYEKDELIKRNGKIFSLKHNRFISQGEYVLVNSKTLNYDIFTLEELEKKYKTFKLSGC